MTTKNTRVARTTRAMTDALKRVRSGKATADHHYMNEMKLISFAMQGKVTPSVDRSALSRRELRRLADIQQLNTQLITAGMAYRDRKALCRRVVVGGEQC